MDVPVTVARAVNEMEVDRPSRVGEGVMSDGLLVHDLHPFCGQRLSVTQIHCIYMPIERSAWLPVIRVTFM